MGERVRVTKDQREFAKGYQAALKDIKEKLAQGGEAAVQEWIANNLAS